MATSQNGWPVLASGSSRLHAWIIPARNGSVRATLLHGSAGFLLAHNALRFAELVQDLTITDGHGHVEIDDWGYAVRPIRGKTSGYSNHAAGCAMDCNATLHPLGRAGSFTTGQVAAIHHSLTRYKECIRWGGDYTGRKDAMHFEIVASLSRCERAAQALLDSPRGVRLLAANPGQKAVILS